MEQDPEILYARANLENAVDFLTSLVVNKPLNILIVAALFLVGYLALRFSAVGEGKNATALLVPTIAWGLYAAWEWFVTTKSPEANIRVDLLILWPVLLGLSIWFVFKALR